MQFSREWTSAVNRRCGNMIPLPLFDQILKKHDPGLMSVYAFDANDSNDILVSGTSEGFARYTPASSHIIIDLDDGDKQLSKCIDALHGFSLNFEVWDSGSKGFHIVVPHQFIHDKRLPYTQMRWVESLGIVADWSIYRPSSLIRLPGCIHKKTGRRKTLVMKFVDKNDLNLTLLEVPTGPEFRVTETSDQDKLLIGLYKLSTLVSEPPEAGARHIRLWSCAQNLADGGLSSAAIEPILQEINARWENPKSLDEVSAAVKQAFRLTR